MPLPPRGSAHSILLEELIHRERSRKWKYHSLEIISLAANVTKSGELISKLAGELDTLFRMEIHAPKAYDFSKTKVDNSKSEKQEKSQEDLLKMLDRIPDA
jgi:hypothetical protein